MDYGRYCIISVVERYVSSVTEKSQQACEKRVNFTLYINIYSLLYHSATYQMIFLLHFQVKHVKLISFFSWLISWLAGKFSTLIKTKSNIKSQLFDKKPIILDSDITFIKNIYIQIERNINFFEMSEENIMIPKFIIW